LRSIFAIPKGARAHLMSRAPGATLRRVQCSPCHVVAMTKMMNTGDMWTCHKGMVETVENKGSQPAVMRVIELVPA
jgi:hypothetical protein